MAKGNAEEFKMKSWVKQNFALLYVAVIVLLLTAGMVLAFFMLSMPVISIPVTGVVITMLMLGLYPHASAAVTELNNE